MATQEEILSLDVRVDDSELTELTDRLGYTRKSLEQVADALDRGVISQAEYAKAATRLYAEEAKLSAAFDQLAAKKKAADEAFVNGPDLATVFRGAGDAAARTEVTLVGAGAGATRYGRALKAAGGEGAAGLMQLGQVIDDLQYVPQMGLRPIINNVMAMAPQVGLALIAFEMLRKGIGAVAASLTGDDIKAFTTDVDAMKKKVEELEGVWIRTAAAVRDVRQAQADLKSAEVAEKLVTGPTEADKEAKKKFETALSDAGSGGAVQSVLQAALGEEFARNGVGMVQEDMQSGRIPQDVAYSMGLHAHSTRGQIAAAMEDPLARQKLREISVNRRRDELMSRLAGGDANANAEVLGLFDRSRDVGVRDEGGEFVNPFARALAGGGKKRDEERAKEEAKARKDAAEADEKENEQHYQAYLKRQQAEDKEATRFEEQGRRNNEADAAEDARRDKADLAAERKRRAALGKREGPTGPRAPRAPRGLSPIDQLTLDAGMGGMGTGGPQFPNTSRGRARMMAAQRKQFNANMRQMRRAMSPAGRRDRAALAALRKGAGNYIHGARADAEGNKPDDLMKSSGEQVKLLTRLVELEERRATQRFLLP